MREAAIVGVADVRWGQIVRAYVVPADAGRPPDVDDLRAHTRARLAGFKVPTEWRLIDALPRNAAGKIQRGDLDSD